MLKYQETKEFQKDFKKLLKKFPTLKEDFQSNKQFRIELFHSQNIDSHSIFKIERVNNLKEYTFFKVKKFQCKSLKGKGANSGIRLIYAYLPTTQTIIFIEIYFKADQKKENPERIKSFINNNFLN